MAVSRMRKIQILAHKSAKAELISALREGGVLHVSTASQETRGGGPSEEIRVDGSSQETRGRGPSRKSPAVEEESAAASTRRAREQSLAARLAKLEYLRTYLKPHAPRRKTLEAMLNPKLLLSRRELDEMHEEFDVDTWYERTTSIESEIRSTEAEIARKQSLAKELEHWTRLGMKVEDIHDTHWARVSLVKVEAREYERLARGLAEEATGEAFEVGRAGTVVLAALVYLKSDEAAGTALLKKHGARAVDLSGRKGNPDDAAEALRVEAEALGEKIERLQEEGEAAGANYDRVLALHDETAERFAKVAVEEKLSRTRETFLLEGWIRTRDVEPLAEKLTDIAPETHMVTREPEDGEDVPIDLRNNGAVSPFEFVTTLYGRPVYWEFDPTPLLAPFFVLFFGLCVSDAGYGLVLAAVTFFFGRKMQPGGGRKLMQLLFLGGLATAAVGAVTGGWFGIDPEQLPAWLDILRIRIDTGDFFNPLRHPMRMLDFVFLLGIVQIFTGLAVKMVADFQEKRWADGILDQLVWIVFLAFLAPLGADFILGKNLPEGLMSTARAGAMVTGLVVVATGARKNRNPIMKVLGGVLKLYDVVGYFGDVLSYARLLALGLATGAIAMAINGVAEMAGGIPVVGIVAAIVVLIGGHLFNLAVNCLGGFVHSARLQYLEYFSKFFHGGGREFSPFRDERRYSVVRERRVTS